MSTSDTATQDKKCSCCKKIKPITEFIRQNKNKPFARCNSCAEEERQKKRAKKLKLSKTKQTPTTSLNVEELFYSSNVEISFVSSNIKAQSLHSDIEIPSSNIDVEVPNPSLLFEIEDAFLYNICDLDELIATKFKDNKELDDSVEFSVIVELESELVNDKNISLEFNQQIEEKKFRNIVKSLLIPIQSGSGYYWEL
ncbi:12819_t:CDS:1 [Cetraspora pellucida]|uniref:12819_t:CDS:1 n=1 Tax=Cetraspora pellucida TaxID=1433469 RepID=A0A9N9FSC7_9GLOM|nr:12819_t:CDS:1 [Cetraspora pellucida]